MYVSQRCGGCPEPTEAVAWLNYGGAVLSFCKDCIGDENWIKAMQRTEKEE